MNTPTNNHEPTGETGRIFPGSRIPDSLLRKIAADLRQAGTGKLSAEVVAAAVARSLQSPVREDDHPVAESVSLDPHSPVARINEIILREARMFRRTGDDLVEVVLTPDAKTQIALRLHWRDGQMEALARCDLGDYQTLNAQWPQLQAALAEHDVRLAPLSERIRTGFTDYFNDPNFARPHRGDRRSPDGKSNPGTTVAAPPQKSPGLVSFRNEDSRRRLLESRV